MNHYSDVEKNFRVRQDALWNILLLNLLYIIMAAIFHAAAVIVL